MKSVNFIRKTILMFFVFLFSVTLSNAQEDFVKGFIITAKSDTITCFIMDKDLRYTDKVVYVLKKSDSKFLKMQKEDYRRVYIGKNVFECVDVGVSSDEPERGSLRVLKLEKNGFVKLLTDIHAHGGSMTNAYGTYETYFMKKGNDELVPLRRIGFQETLREQLSDMPNLNIQGLNYGEIPKLINEYNLWYMSK